MKPIVHSLDCNNLENKELLIRIEKLVKKCRRDSLNMISHFFDLIDIDKDIIDTLRKIDVYINYNMKNSKMMGCYIVSIDNRIHINGKYLLDLFDKLSKNEIKYSKIIKIIKHIIIHEYLHSIRDLYAKLGIVNQETIEYDKMYEMYSSIIEKEMQLLSVIKEKENIILKYYFYGDFIEKIVTDKTLLDKDIIDLYNTINYNSGYYYYASKPIKAYTTDRDYLINICTVNKGKYVGAEEVLVDSFALTIYGHRNLSSYDKSVVEKAMSNELKEDNPSFYSLGFHIISKMDESDIKNYFTTYMQDYFFNDILIDLLNDKYQKTMDTLNYLYKKFDKGETGDNRYKTEYQRCIRLLK